MVTKTRTYVEDQIHTAVKKYAVDKGVDLLSAYSDLIGRVLTPEGKEREQVSWLTREQQELLDLLCKEMNQPLMETLRDLLDIAILYTFTDVSFRQVVANSVPLIIEQLSKDYPDFAKRIMTRYGRYTK